MRNVLKVIFYNFLFLFIIGLFHFLLQKLVLDKTYKQIIIIIYYSLILIFFSRNLKILKKINFSKEKILFQFKLFLSYFSVFTVVFYFFEKSELIFVEFNLNNYVNNLNYFILLPLELLIISIIEELFYRKYMFSELKNNSNLLKIIISNILFSISHLPNDFSIFLQYLFSSMIFSVVYLKTNKIFYSIILHFASNFSLLFYGLHNDLNYVDIVSTNNTLSLFNNSLRSSDLIVICSQFIIVLYFFKYNTFYYLKNKLFKKL